MDAVRVLHITKYYPPYTGGIETTSQQVCLALKKENKYKQVIIAYNDNKLTSYEEDDDYKIVRVGTQIKLASQPLSISYKKELKKILEEFEPQIIHFHFPNPFASHYLLKLKYKGKIIVHYHADIIKQRIIKKFFIKQTKLLLNKADAIIATSPNYLEGTDFLPLYKNRTVIIPSSIQKERTIITDLQKEEAKKIIGKYHGKKIVFFYGRHVEYKGLKYLIQANNELDQNKVQIIIAGTGPLTNYLKEEAKGFNNIEFVGRLNDDEINSYFLACDLFAFPSITRNEALGLTLIESLSFGKPAVTFNIPGSGVNYVNLNNVTGLEANNLDSHQFACNINTILNDNQIYNEFSINAQKRFKEIFSIEAFENNITSLYERFIKDE